MNVIFALKKFGIFKCKQCIFISCPKCFNKFYFSNEKPKCPMCRLGSGPRYMIMSHCFARCASQKTLGHARIARNACDFCNVQKRATKSDTSRYCLPPNRSFLLYRQGCLVQVGNDIELDTVGCQFEPYRGRSCGVTWDSVPEQSW